MECYLRRDVERLKVAEPECGHLGERLLGHNLALDKALECLKECPRLPPSGYTDWYVLVRRKEDGGWEPVRCVEDCDPDFDIEAQQWDLILPIPKPENMPEWDGF